ncbi:hypothetical protein FORC098_3372 [Salmonella enterica subsp. enterica serovar Typhimurium]|nr:hypothetical protein FORC098_3372 [Salmonella enterica subsp. enterica serovar Typhimurium]
MLRASASSFSASTACALSFNSTRLRPRTLSRFNWLRLLMRNCSSRESGFVLGRPGRRSCANRSNVVRSVCSLAMILVTSGETISQAYARMDSAPSYISEEATPTPARVIAHRR